MSRRSRWSVLLAAASILCLAAGFIYLRGGSTPVSVDSAVERFRGQRRIVMQKAVGGSATKALDRPAPRVAEPMRTNISTEVTSRAGVRPLPAEGVYVYATTGGDEVDVLGGSRHEYPTETTVTVSHAGCGLVERWDALEERWDERESCRGADGDTLKRTTSFHEFFGRADRRTLRCTGFTYAAGFEPGSTWSSRCASETTTVALTLTAVGWEDVDVAGRPVRTMHVRVKARLTGEQDGSLTRDVWGSVDTGLVARERSTLTSYSNQPVFGRTRYHESYDNRLLSLEPRR